MCAFSESELKMSGVLLRRTPVRMLLQYICIMMYVIQYDVSVLQK